MVHPYRFAATIPDPRLGRVALARRLEELVALGFDTVSVTDHFASGMDFVAEPLTTLSFVAGLNPSLTVQTGVLCNDYRHPVLTYRMAANLSIVTDGRLELGIGAGWLEAEYRAAGVPFDPPATRVSRLTEAVEILTGLFTVAPFSYAGSHYAVSDVAVFPPGCLPPRPRIMIGGANRRMLQLAGRCADIVGISGSAHVGGDALAEFSPEALARRVDWAIGAAADAGRSAADLELTVPILVTRVTGSTAEATEFADRLAVRYGTDPETLLANPVALIGTPERCAQKLESLRDTYGVTYFHVDPSNLGSDRVDQVGPVIALLRG